uniref:Uncharacterized protein n=1 Tax=Leersia perrieri TaxID=77586 RepID=A0A0D9XRE4_9ORYZ
MRSTELCKIIVTTRNESIARMVAFANQENATPANLVEIGMNIVRKCKGLPLAIRTVGSMLRFQVDETTWRNILECDI